MLMYKIKENSDVKKRLSVLKYTLHRTNRIDILAKYKVSQSIRVFSESSWS